MNQLELNNIAKLFVHSQSLEVANKLGTILAEDVKERVKQVSGPAVHHIHNMALFYTMVRINSLYQTNSNSKAALQEYLEYVEALKPKFLDLVNSLKDFEPACEGNDPIDRQVTISETSYRKDQFIMRKWIETVKPFPGLQQECPYNVRVVDIRKNTETKTMEVTLEFLEPDQLGRRITAHLSLPIRPDGLAAEYLRSCRIEVKPQVKISPCDTIGSEIVARFHETAAGAGWQPIHFEPVSQKEGEENEPIQTQPESTEHRSDVFTVH